MSSFKPENYKMIFNLEERQQILDYLKDENDLLSLAIQFCFISRIGGKLRN